MKIIDLLNKIANGEEAPKKIKYNNEMYHLNIFKTNYFDDIGCSYIDFRNLNDEVEVIEEDKEIEKLKDILRIDDLEPPYDCNLEKIWIQTIKNHNKINKIIDKINSLENKQ